MRGVNKVILLGTLGADPEIRYMPSGAAVANISVATNKQIKDKDTGEKSEQTEWHKIVMFNKLAEIAGEYLKKGSSLYIEGELKTDKYKGKDGVERFYTKIICNSFQIVSGGKKSETNKENRHNQNQYQQPNDAQGSAKEPSNNIDFDDDIPF